MLILFGTHYGKDTSELESSYLLWIIEKFDAADWTLIQACKAELSARLKLDWAPKAEPVPVNTKQLEHRTQLLEKIILLSLFRPLTSISIDGYLQNEPLLNSDLDIANQYFNSPNFSQ